MKYAFCGDRGIAVSILKFLISEDEIPLALIVSDEGRETHKKELIGLIEGLDCPVFYGNQINSDECHSYLEKLNLDYLIGIHFPYIISRITLNIPTIGFLNLHPAYLPFNKGWHTPSWSILDQSTYGATLHFMSEKLDEGDIVFQKTVLVTKEDTANTLYQKVLSLEIEVFIEAFQGIKSLKPHRSKQLSKGTSHRQKDLANMQELYLNEKFTFSEFYDRLRALTTNNKFEAAYFNSDGNRYYVQLKIHKEINE